MEGGAGGALGKNRVPFLSSVPSALGDVASDKWLSERGGAAVNGKGRSTKGSKGVVSPARDGVPRRGRTWRAMVGRYPVALT